MDSFPPFLPGDEANAPFLERAALALRSARPEASPAPMHAFVSSYLRNRRRPYDYVASQPQHTAPQPAGAGSALSEVDEAVLRFLLAPRASLPALLDAPALLDLASLAGASNPGAVAEILRRALEPPPARSALATALQATADVLARELPRGAAQASAPGADLTAIDDVASYACDALHGTARLLSLSPAACALLMPAPASPPSAALASPAGTGVLPHDGPGLLRPARATASQQPLMAAVVSTYERTLPALAALLSSTGEGLSQARLACLQVACHSALLSMSAVLEHCYFNELRSGCQGAGAGSARLNAGRRDAAPRAGATPKPDRGAAALALCSVVSTLGSLQSFDVFAGLALPASARKSATPPGTFFRDLARIFRLTDVVQPLLNGVAADVLSEKQRGDTMRLLAGPELESYVPGIASLADASAASVAAVREVLPEASEEAIVRALSAAGGDVSAAVGKLLAGDGADEVSGGSAVPPETVNIDAQRPGRVAVDPDLRAKTLALARRQELDDVAAVERTKRALSRLSAPTTIGQAAAPGAPELALGSSHGATAFAACRPDVDGSAAAELDHLLEALPDDQVYAVSAPRHHSSGSSRARTGFARDVQYEDEREDDYDDAERFDVGDGGAVGGEARATLVQDGAIIEDVSHEALDIASPEKLSVQRLVREAGVVSGGGGQGGGSGHGGAGAGRRGPGEALGPAGRGQFAQIKAALDDAEAALDAGLVSYRGDAPAASFAEAPGHGRGGRGGRGGGRGGRGGAGPGHGGASTGAPVEGQGPRAAGGYTERAAQRKTQRGNMARVRGNDKKLRAAGSFGAPPAAQ